MIPATLFHAVQPRNVAHNVATERYIEAYNARVARLDVAFRIAPDTSHKVGHKYPAK
jgi:hypothetical protein